MSFAIDNFDDATKWAEVIVGSGSVSDRTAESFKASCIAENDVAGLATVNLQDLTVANISMHANRNTARTVLLIREDKSPTPLSPSSNKYLYAFVRDTAYGIQIMDGYGFLVVQFNDPVPSSEAAEMRIIINNGVIEFYYEGELVFSHTPPGWAAFPFNSLFVYCLAFATRDGITGSGTTSFSTLTGIPLAIDIDPSVPQYISTAESVLFTADVRGGIKPYTVDWYVDGIQVASGLEFVFTSTEIGPHDIYAIATDSTPNSTPPSNTVTVTVEAALPPSPPGETESEMRAIFVHCMSFASADWGLITQTCQDLGLNTVVVEAGEGYHLNETAVADSIAACRARGLKIHMSLDVLIWPHSSRPELWCVGADLQPYNWCCPTKEATRSIVKSIVETLAGYDIDGFMFDYVRYDIAEQCYCPECKAKFEAYLGESITNWPGDFGPGGSRLKEFMEWRIIPITELVKDIRNWMLAIKPDLEFSLAAWTLFQDAPTYWRYWIGQDTAYWIKNKFIDWVAPMTYTTNLAGLEDYILNDLKYFVGAVEGKIPLVMFLNTATGASNFTEPIPPENFKAQVDLLRSLGADGFIIWRYGGPGDSSGAPDIRNYMNILNMPPVFSLADLTVIAVEGQATIRWKTTLPATSKLEYSTSPLFTASYDYNAAVDFNYWDINYEAGTILEDLTPTTNHQIDLFDLTPGVRYYFRVQSKDPSGIATSQVYTFIADGIVTVSITGKIIDSKTAQPVEGATVKAGVFTTISGDDGTFILDVAPGTYTLTIERTGYKTAEIPNINASSDVILTEPIHLEALPKPSLEPYFPNIRERLSKLAIFRNIYERIDNIRERRG